MDLRGSGECNKWMLRIGIRMMRVIWLEVEIGFKRRVWDNFVFVEFFIVLLLVIFFVNFGIVKLS